MRAKFICFSVAFLLCGFFRVNAQSIYVSKKNHYQVKIAGIYKSTLDSLNGGYQDLFTIMHPDSSVKYLINIIRTKSPVSDNEYLKSVEYEASFSDTISKIEEVKEVNYKSLKGIRFLKRITSPQRVFLSYSISTIVKGDLVVITYNTIERNFYKYQSEFDDIVNSITFNLQE
ncbi:MAG TPA: hypothetical protein VGD31_15895 [Sphingobacteriaceae bacterium]